MKHTVDSSTTSKACPKITSRGRRASGVASGSIPTAITPSTPGRYGNGGSAQSKFESKKKSVTFIKACYNLGSARTISANERETDMHTHVKETQFAARIVSDPRWTKI